MHKYDAAVIGLGNIGARFHHPNGLHPFNHAEALLRHNRIRLIGGVDPLPDNRAHFKQAYGLPAYVQLEDVLDQKPSFVSICSPSSFHYSQAMACLEAGVQMIWLEKPPVDTPAELEALQVRAVQCGARILVNFQRRYCANFQAVRDLFANSRLGEPKVAQLFYSRGLELNGSHMLDILFFVTQDRGSIRLDMASEFNGSENPSFTFSTDGFPVHVSGFNLAYHCVELMVFFEQGRASIRYSGLGSQIDLVIENEYAPGYYRLSDGGADVQLPPSEMTCIFPFVAIDDLIAAFEGGQAPSSSLETASQTLQLIHLVRTRLK